MAPNEGSIDRTATHVVRPAPRDATRPRIAVSPANGPLDNTTATTSTLAVRAATRHGGHVPPVPGVSGPRREVPDRTLEVTVTRAASGHAMVVTATNVHLELVRTPRADGPVRSDVTTVTAATVDRASRPVGRGPTLETVPVTRDHVPADAPNADHVN